MAKGSVLRTVELPVTAAESVGAAPLRLDIGCGKTKLDGWTGIDTLDFGQAWLADLSMPGKWVMYAKEAPQYADYPPMYAKSSRVPADLTHKVFTLPDNCVDEIRSSHFVEHLTGAERVSFWNELYRLMKPGATALIVTPNWSHSCAYGDPTHQWPPMSQWYPLYLNKVWRDVNAPHVPLTCDFDHVVAGSWDQSLEVRNQEYKQFGMTNFTNAWRDLIVTLTKRG